MIIKNYKDIDKEKIKMNVKNLKGYNFKKNQKQWDKKPSIIFTNGFFDLLHIGHIRCLKKMRELGGVVIVGLNSDESIRKLKGIERPIFPLEERMEILDSLEYVDIVTSFDDVSSYNIIKHISPDILVKGKDWENKVIGQDYVESYGGKVILFELTQNKSTTNIIKKLKNG